MNKAARKDCGGAQVPTPSPPQPAAGIVARCLEGVWYDTDRALFPRRALVSHQAFFQETHPCALVQSLQLSHEVETNFGIHGHVACKLHGWDENQRNQLHTLQSSFLYLTWDVTKRKAASHLRLIDIFVPYTSNSSTVREGKTGKGKEEEKRVERVRMPWL